MKRKMNVKKKRLLCIILAVVLLVALIPPLRNFVLNIGGTIISPFTSAMNSGSKGVSGLVYSITHAGGVHKQNQKLQLQLSTLENELAAYEGLKRENERLNKLLALREAYTKLDTVAAEIIAKEDGNWFSTFTINKGKGDGIKSNQPVISGNGLVGRTAEVGPNWAKVVAVIDTEHAVSGKVARNGDYVLVEGHITLMHDGKCRMTNITEDADIVAGDTIISSGMGGVYPEGIVIGTVESFEKSETGSGSYAIIKPAVDFQRVQEVLVLKTEA
ncbi:MAG: rod shape-determining protein MreC [Clostridia bacterium]|nr:rod shape-determining protein MreC [Clostridia bacterium]